MKHHKGVWLAAGLIAGAAMMTGCTADTKPVATPTPKAVQQQTAQPATAQPTASAQPEASPEATAQEEETPAPLALEVDGKTLETDALDEHGDVLLPLTQTGEALGWKASDETTKGDTQDKRIITLEKDDSRITVSWTVSDNTVKGVTWQKDGLLIPVDTRITTKDDVGYVPAAFFEEAMNVKIAREENGVKLTAQQPAETPKTQEETSGQVE